MKDREQKEHIENFIFSVSVPLEYGDVQRVHDVLKNLYEAKLTKELRDAGKYLNDKSNEARYDHPHDSSVLADLAALALNLVEDSLDKNN